MRWGNDAQGGSPRLFSARRTLVLWIVKVAVSYARRGTLATRSLERVLEMGNASGDERWEMVVSRDTPRCVRKRP